MNNDWMSAQLSISLCTDNDGYRRILGVSVGHKEDKAGWPGVLEDLNRRASANRPRRSFLRRMGNAV